MNLNENYKEYMNSVFQQKKDAVYHHKFDLSILEYGYVASAGDGIVWIEGLPTAKIDEVIYIECGCYAIVFQLTKDLVGAILLTQTEELLAGNIAYHTNKLLNIPVGDELLGRVIDPLGYPLDGLEQPKCKEFNNLDILAPPIIDRDFVNEPLYTGNKIVDNLIPIGKGQRELLIGDNGLGKSSLALDIVINQKDKNVLCIYVLIGQKRSSVKATIDLLKKMDALEHVVIVVAEATSKPGLKYLAPFSGCAIAEHWMNIGRDTLIVYDDLSSHANCYRELALLMKSPPGREAYPADIFHLHARLLERATCLSPSKGGGSMTALPIIETKEGELSTYIPTNLISITDGQIYFDEKLFSSGFLPAIDISKSVSRVGGKAQDSAIKKEAGTMKFDYLQFLELETFTKFGAKLEKSMQNKIKRGHLLREILKQERLFFLSIEFQLAWLIAFNSNMLDDIDIKQIPSILKQLDKKVKESNLKLLDEKEAWVNHLHQWLNKE